MTDQSAVHNEIVGDIVRSIVTPPIAAGGTMSQVMVVLESVVLGVLLVAAKEGSAEILFDQLIASVRGRLADDRRKKN